jgi:predicted RNA polymerase sigma factor
MKKNDEVQDRLGEANTHKSIGDLHVRRDRLDAAEASFARALELYQDSGRRTFSPIQVGLS